MEYRSRHAGDASAEEQTRESAGMVTYDRTSVSNVYISPALHGSEETIWAHLLNLRVDTVDRAEPLPRKRFCI